MSVSWHVNYPKMAGNQGGFYGMELARVGAFTDFGGLDTEIPFKFGPEILKIT